MHVRNTFFEAVSALELVKTYGTPLYVYNEHILRQRLRELRALSTHPGFCVNYSAKANTNVTLLGIIHEEGCLADAMSPGELYINLRAGFTPDTILYVCNNVSAEEIRNAVAHKVLLSVDSLDQLDVYGRVNPGGRIMVRMNPGIGAGHHQKVITAGKETKFGVNPDDMPQLCELVRLYSLRLAGLNQHIGSLFMEPEGYLAAAEFLLSLADSLPTDIRTQLEIIDFGGGFGIPYRKSEGQPRLNMTALGSQLHALLNTWSARTGYAGRFFIEPGRYAVAECGVVLGAVHAVKNNGPHRFVGTDVGFNVLMRPAMYEAHHDISFYREGSLVSGPMLEQTIVGNICESGDILAKKRLLPQAHTGDIMAVWDAGAYGYVMASPYNQRLRPAEVLIRADGSHCCIRRRESIEDLMASYAGL